MNNTTENVSVFKKTMKTLTRFLPSVKFTIIQAIPVRKAAMDTAKISPEHIVKSHRVWIANTVIARHRTTVHINAIRTIYVS